MKAKLLFLFCLFTTTLFSQGVNNLWLMGYSGWAGPPFGWSEFNFTGGSLTITYDSTYKMNFGETNGVICNRNGDFLFSSNGVWIANALNDTMLNGAGLNPSYYTSSWGDVGEGLFITQANLIIPFPGDTNKYYLFHQTIDDYGPSTTNTFCAQYLYYTVIDITGDNGRGAVIQKNNILFQDSLITGGLIACKHANGRDWWLITHQYRTGNKQFFSASDLYYKFLITPNGIQSPDTQSIGMQRAAANGHCVFSPDGKYFAVYETINVDIFDFDRCTGIFSQKTNFFVRDSAASWGVAFSPNSQLLYVSSGRYLDQFDMNASDIAALRVTVSVQDSTSTGFFLSQLAPDGKIYIASSGAAPKMHVINNPDVIGMGCNACRDCVTLPAFNAWTIPNHPNYFLGAESGSPCDSLTTAVQVFSVQRSTLSVFPNPVSSSGEVTFTYPSDGEVKSISVFNVEGKEVAGYPLPQWSSVQKVKLPELAKGVYMARLHGVIEWRLGDEAIPVLNVKFVIE